MTIIFALIAAVTITVTEFSEPVQSVTAEADLTPVPLTEINNGESWVGTYPTEPTQVVAYMTDLSFNVGMAVWSANDTPTPTPIPTGFISPASGEVFPSGAAIPFQHYPVISPNDGFWLDEWDGEWWSLYTPNYISSPNVGGIASATWTGLPDNQYRCFYLSYQSGGSGRSRVYFSIGGPTHTPTDTPDVTPTYTPVPTDTPAPPEYVFQSRSDPPTVLATPVHEAMDEDNIPVWTNYYLFWNCPGRAPGWKIEQRIDGGSWAVIQNPIIFSLGELRIISGNTITVHGELREYRVTVLRDDSSDGGSVSDAGSEPPVWMGGIRSWTATPTPTPVGTIIYVQSIDEVKYTDTAGPKIMRATP